jgi:hypothetical protein
MVADLAVEWPGLRPKKQESASRTSLEGRIFAVNGGSMMRELALGMAMALGSFMVLPATANNVVGP